MISEGAEISPRLGGPGAKRKKTAEVGTPDSTDSVAEVDVQTTDEEATA